MQKNRRLLFEYADLKGATLDAEACKNVFGKIACKEAQAQLAERSPEKKERKTIHRRAVEQCALTHRAPEELRQRRQEIVELLEDGSCCIRYLFGKCFGQVVALLRTQARFDSPVRAWANLLDLHAKGKLKRREFQTSMSVLGYAGNVKKLWEEMGLKPKQSVRFKDLCPEVIDEIREFKNMAGKKIITLIQVSEVAAGPGKSKKAGVPVDTDEYYKVIDAIDYPGDAERLLRHLDPGNVGYVNTRTLRILNEQKSEEKAVPQYLKKYRENKQTQLEQKIASVIMPPVRELLAKQDSVRESSLEEPALKQFEGAEWSSKKEVRDARENFIRALTDKFGSLAKAWRLALDPELKMVIENVDQLMKGLRRSGQMPDGGEHALRLKAEKIFQACQNKETEQIALEDLDPRTPAMLEKFKDLCEHRFGSLQDAFEAIDVEGDFRQLCHEIKLTDGMFRLLEFLDPKRTGEVRLSLIDREVAEDAMKSTKLGKKALLEVRRRLVKRLPRWSRAWKKVQGKATKEIGRDGWLSFFEEVGMQNHEAQKAWELLPVEEDKLSLTLFEPGIGRDLEAFHQKIIERFRSAKNMMLKMRDGGAALDKKRFLEVCYECQTTGNENRLFEYLEDRPCIETSALSRIQCLRGLLSAFRLADMRVIWPNYSRSSLWHRPRLCCCTHSFVPKDAKTQSEVPKPSLETPSAKDASLKVVPSQEDGEVSFERIDEKVLSCSSLQLSDIAHEGLSKHEAIRASSVARYSLVVPAVSAREAGAEVKELIAQEEPFTEAGTFSGSDNM
ncbi:VPS54 [Symbiodinium sp. CCMP2456]|nr:VPS54 [Symbiodinium sp. CCMP2456]